MLHCRCIGSLVILTSSCCCDSAWKLLLNCCLNEHWSFVKPFLVASSLSQSTTFSRANNAAITAVTVILKRILALNGCRRLLSTVEELVILVTVCALASAELYRPWSATFRSHNADNMCLFLCVSSCYVVIFNNSANFTFLNYMVLCKTFQSSHETLSLLLAMWTAAAIIKQHSNNVLQCCYAVLTLLCCVSDCYKVWYSYSRCGDFLQFAAEINLVDSGVCRLFATSLRSSIWHSISLYSKASTSISWLAFSKSGLSGRTPWCRPILKHWWNLYVNIPAYKTWRDVCSNIGRRVIRSSSMLI